MKNKTFIHGAAILIICNLIGKVLGAIYRIPLAGIVGGVGMGEYQLAFPLYCLILTVSTSGIPVAISKLVAEFNTQNRYKDSKRLLRISLLLLSVISIIGAGLIVVGAKLIAGLQGNPNAYICYYGIAPAIVFVGVLSVLRGYFQGNLIMFPTAVSSLIEQLFKMIFGLLFATRLASFGVEYAVLGALAGISLSELIACLFLLVCYVVYSKKKKISGDEEEYSRRFITKRLFSLSVPITLGGLISPITAMVDSLLVINLLMFTGFASSSATMLLGLQSGVVEPLINLPVVIAVSISTAMLPSLSSLQAKAKLNADVADDNSNFQIKNLIEKSYQITLSISIAFAICFVIFGKQILSFLYGRSFDPQEINIATKLLFLGSINVVLLSLVQVTAGALQALGKPKQPVIALAIGCVIKIGLDVALISIPAVGIMGAVIAGGVCYFVVLSINYNKVKKLTGAKILNDDYMYVCLQECFVCMFAYFGNVLLKNVFSEMVSMFVAGGVAVAVLMVTYYVFFMSRTQNMLSQTNVPDVNG